LSTWNVAPTFGSGLTVNCTPGSPITPPLPVTGRCGPLNTLTAESAAAACGLRSRSPLPEGAPPSAEAVGEIKSPADRGGACGIITARSESPNGTGGFFFTAM